MPRLVSILATVGVLVAASAAAAETLHTRKPRGKPRGPDVGAALASGDPLRICRTAIALGTSGDHVRAGMLVSACERVAVDAGLADAARKTRIAVSRAATTGNWSKVELVIKTDGATAIVDAYPEIPLTSGAWRLPPGTYIVTARTSGGAAMSELVLRDGNRSLVVLEPPPPPPPARHKTVDFTSGEPMAAPVAGPPKVEHESLIPERYRKGLGKPRR